MKFPLPLLLAGLLLATAFTGCSENTPEPNQEAEKTEMLTAKKWYLKSEKLTAGDGQVTVFTDADWEDDCRRDDFTRFNKNKTVVLDPGEDKCGQQEQQAYQSLWEFQENATKLAWGGSVYKIIELTPTKLVMETRTRHLTISETEYTGR